MSLALDAANYFYRGTPDVAGAYPDGTFLPSTVSGFSICGLAMHTAAASISFEPYYAMSGRYNGGGYFFSGWRDGLNIYADAGGGLAYVATEPAIGTWHQWMCTDDPAGNQLLFAWKLYGDANWTMSILTAHVGTQALLKRMFLGTDEYGTGAGGKVALANVRCWYKLKTAASLLTDVNSATLVDAVGIHAWWKLRSDNPTADSSGAAHPLTMVGAPSAAGLPANSLEAPSDGTPATVSVPGIERTTSVGATSARGGARVSVVDLQRFTNAGIVNGTGGGRAVPAASATTTAIGAAIAHGGGRSSVPGATATATAGVVTGFVDIRGVVEGVVGLSAIGAISARGAARVAVPSLSAQSFVGLITTGEEITVVERALTLVPDDGRLLLVPDDGRLTLIPDSNTMTLIPD